MQERQLPTLCCMLGTLLGKPGSRLASVTAPAPMSSEPCRAQLQGPPLFASAWPGEEFAKRARKSRPAKSAFAVLHADRAGSALADKSEIPGMSKNEFHAGDGLDDTNEILLASPWPQTISLLAIPWATRTSSLLATPFLNRNLPLPHNRMRRRDTMWLLTNLLLALPWMARTRWPCPGLRNMRMRSGGFSLGMCSSMPHSDRRSSTCSWPS